MKHCFSGSHGTGKTTSVYNYAMTCKIQFPGRNVGISSENARVTPYKPINQNSCKNNQLWIFTDQISKEIKHSSTYNLLICDRTCVDSIAYTWFIDESLAKSMLEFAKEWVYTYNKIYFKTIDNNDYLEYDGIRDCDRDYRQRIEDKMLECYNILSNYSSWDVVYV